MASFELPTVEKKTKLIQMVHAVQKTCKLEYNFRLSFTDGNAGLGSVSYYQTNQTGLRLRYQC